MLDFLLKNVIEDFNEINHNLSKTFKYIFLDFYNKTINNENFI
jgi:hypothetical protein